MPGFKNPFKKKKIKKSQKDNNSNPLTPDIEVVQTAEPESILEHEQREKVDEVLSSKLGSTESLLKDPSEGVEKNSPEPLYPQISTISSEQYSGRSNVGKRAFVDLLLLKAI